MYFI
jgi:hypothetical protein